MTHSMRLRFPTVNS
ncbi:erythromycin resistance leader peptide [Robertmurraya massiliosenegalensis]